MPKEVFRPRLRVPAPLRDPVVRGDRAGGAPVRGGLGVTQAAAHRRRAAGPPRPGTARRHAGRGRAGIERHRDDHERRAAGAPGAGARRRRPAPRHGQPRLAGRRRVRGGQRHGRAPWPSARGHRGGGGRRLGAGQGEHGREAGLNDSGLVDMATLPRQRHVLRLSSTWTSAPPTAGGWTTSSPPPRWSAAIDAELPLEPVEAAYRGEVAHRYRYRDGSGEIGVIASVTQPFCRDCTRARLSRTAASTRASSRTSAATCAGRSGQGVRRRPARR